MTRGKHGIKAEVRDEFAKRDVEIARLRRELARTTAERDALKRRVAEYQTKLGAWSAEQNEAIERRAREAALEMTAAAVKAAGTAEESYARFGEGMRNAFCFHMQLAHEMDPVAARDFVNEQFDMLPREFRRKAARLSAAGANRFHQEARENLVENFRVTDFESLPDMAAQFVDSAARFAEEKDED